MEPVGVGTLIRELRQSRGWSQAQLAAELSTRAGCAITREYISRRWESGRSTPSAFWLRHLSAVLDVPVAVLENDVNRRTFLTDLAATSIAPLVASDLLADGFAARLAGSGPSLDQWEAKLAAYGTDYMTNRWMGAAEIQRRLASELVVLQQQPDHPRLWTVAARLMTLYAKTYPGSDGGKAVGWYRLAARAADHSGDDATRVWVRGRAAIALGYEGSSLPVADLLADQALALTDRPSLGRLNALMGKAHASVLRGDHSSARALIDDARRVFDIVGSDDNPSDYAVPWWRMNVFISLAAARLGDQNLAVDAQDAAARDLPASLPRFTTHLELHRGLMIARSGDPAGGQSYARAALDRLPPAKHSLTLRMLMDEITSTTPGAAGARH